MLTPNHTAIVGAGGVTSLTIGFLDSAAATKLDIVQSEAEGRWVVVVAVLRGIQNFSTINGESVGSLSTWTDLLEGYSPATGATTASVKMGIWAKQWLSTDPNTITVVRANTPEEWQMWVGVIAGTDTQVNPGAPLGSQVSSSIVVTPYDAAAQPALFIGGKNSGATNVDLNWSGSSEVEELNSWNATAGTQKLGVAITIQDVAVTNINRTLSTTPTTTCHLYGVQIQLVEPAVTIDGDGLADFGFTSTGDGTVVKYGDGDADLGFYSEGTGQVISAGGNNLPVVELTGTPLAWTGTTRTVMLTATDADGDTVTLSLGASYPWVTLTDLGETSTDVFQAELTAAPTETVVGGVYPITVRANDGTGIINYTVDWQVFYTNRFVRAVDGSLHPIVKEIFVAVPAPTDTAIVSGAGQANFGFAAEASGQTITDGHGLADFGFAATMTASGAGQALWRRLIVRTEEEFDLGRYGGGGKQHMRAGARSPSDPERIYFWVDIAHSYRSDDSGGWWHTPLDKGFGVIAITAGAVSNTDPNLCVILGDDHFEDDNNGREGLYRSIDGCESWQFVYPCHPDRARATTDLPVGYVAGTNDAPTRLHHQTIVNSVHNTNHWFAMVDSWGFCRSLDNGVTWEILWDVANNGQVKDVYKILEDPTTQGVFYLACYRNVWKLTGCHGAVASMVANRITGAGGTALQGAGSSMVRYICFEDGDDGNSALLASVSAIDAATPGYVGRSTDHNGTWTTVLTEPDLEYVWCHPGMARFLMVYQEGTAKQGKWANAVGGPYTAMTCVMAPGWTDSFGSRIQGQWVGFYPSADDPLDIWAYSQNPLYHSRDGGKTWTWENEGNDGYNQGWTWRCSYQDPEDSQHYWFSSADVGPIQTETAGDFFHLTEPKPSAYNGAKGAHGAAMMGTATAESRLFVVAAIGDTNNAELQRATNRGDEAADWVTTNTLNRRRLGIWPYKLNPEMDVATRAKARAYGLAGYQRTQNGGQTYSSSGLTTDAEWNGYMWNDPDIFFAIQHFGTDALKAIWRGELNLTTSALAVTRVWLSPGHKLVSRGAWGFSHTNRNLLYVGTADGGIARYNVSTGVTTDLDFWGAHSSLTAMKAAYPKTNIIMIDVSAFDDDHVAVLLSIHGANQIWRTLDGGDTWQDIAVNLPRLANGNIEWMHHTGELLFSSSKGLWVFPHHPSVAPEPDAELLYDHAVDVVSLIDNPPTALYFTT